MLYRSYPSTRYGIRDERSRGSLGTGRDERGHVPTGIRRAKEVTRLNARLPRDASGTVPEAFRMRPILFLSYSYEYTRSEYTNREDAAGPALLQRLPCLYSLLRPKKATVSCRPANSQHSPNQQSTRYATTEKRSASVRYRYKESRLSLFDANE